MPVTLNSTGITFSDGESQNTVAGGGVQLLSAEYYNGSKTYVKNNSATLVEVCVAGGGGGFSVGPQGDNGTASGGGGGGAMRARFDANAITATVGVNVGGRGNCNGSANTLGNGNTGGTTAFGTYITANGGQGGRYGNGTQSGGPGGTASTNLTTNYIINVTGGQGGTGQRYGCSPGGTPSNMNDGYSGVGCAGGGAGCYWQGSPSGAGPSAPSGGVALTFDNLLGGGQGGTSRFPFNSGTNGNSGGAFVAEYGDL